MRLVLEHQGEHDSQWSAIPSVASKLGCTAETLRKWVRQADCRPRFRKDMLARSLPPRKRGNDQSGRDASAHFRIGAATGRLEGGYPVVPFASIPRFAPLHGFILPPRIGPATCCIPRFSCAEFP